MRTAPFYEDLVLKVERAPGEGGLQVRLLRSPFGSSHPAVFHLPFPDEEPVAILRFLEASIPKSGSTPAGPGAGSRNVTSADTHRQVSPGEVGQALFEALFVGPIRENLLKCLALIELKEDTGLRIRLVLDPTLADLVNSWPWELLYDHQTRDYLGRNVRTPIVRQLEVQRPSLTPTPMSKLGILVVLSDPKDLPRLQVAREKELIEDAVGAAPDVDLQFLDEPTIEGLRWRVRRRPFDVLHFVGHGDLGEDGQGTLMFEGPEGNAHAVSGAVLADTLKGLHPVRLVILNACQTARQPRDAAGHDPFLGAASALIMAGIPAVVAMQFPISDRAALVFSSAFYRHLISGDPLESAVAEGRMAILHAQSSTWEWATPVLFLGVPHGQLFDLRSESEQHQDAIGAAAEKAKQEDARQAETSPPPQESGLDLLERLRYEQAVVALLEAQQAEPSNPTPAYYLALARLNGRRPRSARLDVIKRIEADLETASYLAGGEDPAHLCFLRALIKHDFYRFKGLRIQPPLVEELLLEAQAAPADAAELRRLLAHVSTPPSPVREAIEMRLLGLASK